MHRPRFGLSLFAASFGLLATSAAMAAKPAPPPPPVNLPGIIYYTSGFGTYDVWAMNPDGTNQTLVLSGYSGIPCFHPQGSSSMHDRWFLASLPTPGKVYDVCLHAVTGEIIEPRQHYDVYAFRAVPGDPTQVEYVQLTDLFGMFLSSGAAAWSNDSNDDPVTSFVGTDGRDIRNAFSVEVDAEGNTYTKLDFRLAPSFADLRLPVTAGEIQDGWLGGDFVPYRPNTPGDLNLLLSRKTGIFGGDAKLLSRDGGESVTPAGGVFLTDVFTGATTTTLWNAANGEPTRAEAIDWSMIPAWSPDETKITIINNYPRESRGGIWRISTTGEPPVQLGKNYYGSATNYHRWDNCYWSPDSQFLMCNRGGYKKNRYFRDIVILPGNGGAPVREFLNFPGFPLRWVSATPAP